MNLELDFYPHLILFFTRTYRNDGWYCSYKWGDEELYKNCNLYIHSLLPNAASNPGPYFMAIQSGTLKHKIFEGNIKDD